MYRFVWSPRWLVGHALVLAAVVLMANFGLWQLRRLDERQSYNALVKARTAAPVADIGQVVPAGSETSGAGPGTGIDVEAVTYRRVVASGTYDPTGEVQVRPRTMGGRNGAWLVTPLTFDGGRAVLVNRGWVPLGRDGRADPSAFPPPPGPVTVTGILLPPEERGRFGPRDRAGERLSEVARIDIRRLQQQSSAPLVPVQLQLESQEPTEPPGAAGAAGGPVPLQLAPLSEGPHLGYAGQWFAFATIAAAGWPLLIRKSARERRTRVAAGGRAGAPPRPLVRDVSGPDRPARDRDEERDGDRDGGGARVVSGSRPHR